MGTIKDLPSLDRPREKAYRYGLSSLSDAELLSILISSGYAGNSALTLATNLLIKYGGLTNLKNATLEELKKEKGIKEAKAINLGAIFELANRIEIKNNDNVSSKISSEYLYNKYKTKLLGSNQESLYLIMLSHKNKILHEKVLYIGTENNVIFSYKDIWRELLTFHAKYFYLIHNHPGKSCEPSRQDVAFTSELYLESKRIQIPMIDHIIIGSDGYYSFSEEKSKKSYCLNL